MLIAIVLVCVAAAVPTLFGLFGMRQTAICSAYLTLALYPQLLGHRTLSSHIGMAPQAPEIRTFTIVLLPFLVASLLLKRSARPPLAFFLLLLWLAIGMIQWWDDGLLQWAGIVQISLGISGWIAGKVIAGWVDERPSLAKPMVLTLTFIVLVQLLVATMQKVGIAINSLPPAQAAQVVGRSNGTLNHPDNLGKALLLLMVVLLFFTRSVDPFVRRVATFGYVMAFIPLALGQGRANFLAVLILTVMWAVLMPRTQGAGRLGIVIGVGFVTIAALAPILSRFSEDPNGGLRPQLLAIAYDVIPHYLAFGMGPNSYTQVTALNYQEYVPVHNSFLLILGELGIVGFVLFFSPYVLTFLWSFAQFRQRTVRGDGARALICLFPGIFIIAYTGWGMDGTSVLPLWFLTTGFLNAVGRKASIEEPKPKRRNRLKRGRKGPAARVNPLPKSARPARVLQPSGTAS